MKMTAAVMYQQGLPAPYAKSIPFHVEQVDLEGPGDGEVLVEIGGAGLCHSDLSQVAGLRKRTLPVVGGHEGAGIVREVGRGVTGLKPGDHVVMSAISSCGHCRPCLNSRPVLCESVTAPRTKGLLANGNRKMSVNGKPVFHYSGVSTFAQYSVVVPSSLIIIDPTVPLDIAAMFGCAVSTGAGAVFNTARVKPGQSVAVFGLGGVGLNSVMAAKVAGASQIIGIDMLDSKFPLARELGCTHTFNARDPDLVQAVRDITRGGVDYSFEASGAKGAMTTAYAITAKGGEMIGIGLGTFDDMYQYPHSLLVSEEKAIRGSFMGSCNVERDVPMFIGMYLDGKLPVDRLKSSSMGFADLNSALDLLASGEVVRQILLPNAA